MGQYDALHQRSNAIEACLVNRGTPATVVGGKVLPGFTEFLLRPAPGVKVMQMMQAQPDLRLALGRQDVRVVQSGTHLAVQVPRNQPESVKLETLLAAGAQDEVPRYSAVLGVGDDGAVLQACIAAPEVAHVLIAGTTGSGKTSLAQSMIWSLSKRHRPSELGLVVIDPKGSVGAISRDHALMNAAVDPRVAMDVLRKVVEVMEKRRRLSEPRILVYIDELADLAMSTGGAAVEPITRIAQRGREVGVHLLACTQKPAAREIGTLLKANLPLRLVGRVLSPEDARVATGLPATGAETLRGRGDFLAVVGGRTIRFQAALPPVMPVILPSPDVVAPMVVAAPAEIVAPAPENPAEVVGSGEAAGIDDESVQAALVILKRRGLPVTRARVLALLGYQQAGGASRRLNDVGERMKIEWA